VNTLVLDRDGWAGYNTDGAAALRLLRRHVDPAGKRAAIAGAGGTARALAVSLRDAGCRVELFNRTADRAASVAKELGIRGGPLEAIGRSEWDVLVNATPLGTDGEMPVPADSLTGGTVLDVVYGTRATPLVREARRLGLAVVDGFEMLVEQALLQFRIMTGREVDRRLLATAGRQWLESRVDSGHAAT
jgi:shikimate dehydrogenase